MGRPKKIRNNGDDGKDHKTWMITLNNPEKDEHWIDRKYLLELFDRNSLSSGVIEEEIGKCGTVHWQCRVTFVRNKRYQYIKDRLPHSNIRWSIKKELDYETKGKTIRLLAPSPGLRSDLTKIHEDCKNMSIREVCIAHPDSFIRFHAGIEKTHRLVNEQQDDKGNYDLSTYEEKLDMDFKGTHIVIGEAGSGKTQWVLAHFKNPCLITGREDFGKFKQDIHDGIVIDDMDLCEHFKGQNLVNVLDFDCKRTINIKYGSATIPKNTKKVIIHNDLSKVLRFEQQFMRRVFVTEVGNSNTKLPPSLKTKKISKLFHTDAT